MLLTNTHVTKIHTCRHNTLWHITRAPAWRP